MAFFHRPWRSKRPSLGRCRKPPREPPRSDLDARCHQKWRENDVIIGSPIAITVRNIVRNIMIEIIRARMIVQTIIIIILTIII